VLDFVRLFLGDAGLESDAVSMLGELARLQEALQRAPAAQHFTVVLANLGPENVSEPSARLSKVTDGAWSVASTDWRDACRGSASTILITRDPSVDAVPAVTWVLGDPIHGLSGFEDVGRRVREVLHVPIARPISPAQRSGAIVLIGSAESKTLVLRAAYRDSALDWVDVEGSTITYIEDTDVEDWLVGREGGSRLVFSVRKSTLYLTRANTVPKALWRGSTWTLISLEVHEAIASSELRPWHAIRHQSLK
jgi:hypothetical protein